MTDYKRVHGTIAKVDARTGQVHTIVDGNNFTIHTSAIVGSSTDQPYPGAGIDLSLQNDEPVAARISKTPKP